MLESVKAGLVGSEILMRFSSAINQFRIVMEMRAYVRSKMSHPEDNMAKPSDAYKQYRQDLDDMWKNDDLKHFGLISDEAKHSEVAHHALVDHAKELLKHYKGVKALHHRNPEHMQLLSDLVNLSAKGAGGDQRFYALKPHMVHAALKAGAKGGWNKDKSILYMDTKGGQTSYHDPYGDLRSLVGDYDEYPHQWSGYQRQDKSPELIKSHIAGDNQLYNYVAKKSEPRPGDNNSTTSKSIRRKSLKTTSVTQSEGLETKLFRLAQADQAPRNAYKKYLKNAGGAKNWEVARNAWIKDKKADPDDIFNDKSRHGRIERSISNNLGQIKANPKLHADAWLLTQHMDHNVPFQRKVLKILPTDSGHYRYLQDRIATNTGQPQKYGTQKM